MGFIRDFGSKVPPRTSPPQTPASAPASEAAPTPRPKKRGFFADFNPEAALAAEQQRDAFVPRYQEQAAAESAQSESVERAWNRPERPGYSNGPLFQENETAPTRSEGMTFGSSLEVANLTNEIQNVADKLRGLSSSSFGGGWEPGVGQIEQEIGSTRQAISQAKDSVQQKRARIQRLERFLERTRQMVSRLEMRMSGFDSGWTRGYGGNRWHRGGGEFLYTRGELRGPENADERKAQMALMLDSRRDRVWKLQDELSSARSGYSQAESKVKELEYKLGRLQDKLSKTRDTRQNRQEQKASLESKLEDLKARYRKLTGRSYGQFF
ncbi:MAG: hypothetical protein WC314_06255 [Vulcanimicrobiota bacterium]